MTATNLFTARDNSTARLKTGSQIAGVTVAVKEAESHTYTATLTKLALESGASVTDHMILEPETVAVSFSVTNAGQGKQNAKDAFEAFVTMQRSRKLVELVTEHLYGHGSGKPHAVASGSVFRGAHMHGDVSESPLRRTGQRRARAFTACKRRGEDRSGADAIGKGGTREG